LMPCRLASAWKRAAPYSPLWSASPIAGIPSTVACSISISGYEAPARKLKVLDVCSSTYSQSR
jgi:hypothetical protein